MKKLRVFPTVKTKRIVPGSSFKKIGTVLFILLLLPYLITFLFGNLKEGAAVGPENALLGSDDVEDGASFVNIQTGLGIFRVPLEVYVADKLARSIDNGYEAEALKAQAVLIRSGLLTIKDEAGTNKANINKAGINEVWVMDEGYGSVETAENIQEAVSQTAGVCLTYDGRPISGAYFAVSNGATRNADELGLSEYPYLKSVECGRDFLSDDFSSSLHISEAGFMKIWQELAPVQITEGEILSNGGIAAKESWGNLTLYRDSADYVLYLEREGKYVAGEQFRDAFYLSSASFQMTKEDGQIQILVKGAGHGLGMSQFGANEMAKEGEDYIKILGYFFQDAKITKFE